MHCRFNINPFFFNLFPLSVLHDRTISIRVDVEGQVTDVRSFRGRLIFFFLFLIASSVLNVDIVSSFIVHS
jgi:hypothetical protein